MSLPSSLTLVGLFLSAILTAYSVQTDQVFLTIGCVAGMTLNLAVATVVRVDRR